MKMLINSLPQIKNDYIFNLCEKYSNNAAEICFAGVKGYRVKKRKN